MFLACMPSSYLFLLLQPPCGTGALDGGMDRAENFKKVLEVMFDGSPPQVGSSDSIFDTGGDSDSSTTTSAGSLWYPDYNSNYALGKCVNEVPVPSGRPNYDSGEACCQAAYGTQSSEHCMSSLSGQASSLSSGGEPPPGPTPTRPPIDPTSEAGLVISSKIFIDMESTLESVKDEIDSKLFLYQTPAFQWIPSSVYKYRDFKESLYVMATEGVANKKFYIGDDDVENGHVYGLVNIAAFLAQSMKETIQYDACDENSWDLVGGKYPLSNACGQLGQSVSIV